LLGLEISNIRFITSILIIIRKTGKEFGYNYNLKPCFLASLKSHIKRLKELGDPNLNIPKRTIVRPVN
jgi:hypothetical protein